MTDIAILIERWKKRIEWNAHYDVRCELEEETIEALSRFATALENDGSKIWDLINSMRAEEGHSVTILSDNPDFNGQPNCAIVVCGDWTGWKPRRFTADTVLDALRSAVETMEASKAES